MADMGIKVFRINCCVFPAGDEPTWALLVIVLSYHVKSTVSNQLVTLCHFDVLMHNSASV